MSGNLLVVSKETGKAADLTSAGGNPKAQDDEAGKRPGWVATRVGEIEVGGDEAAPLCLHRICESNIGRTGESLFRNRCDIMTLGSEHLESIPVDVLVELDPHVWTKGRIRSCASLAP